MRKGHQDSDAEFIIESVQVGRYLKVSAVDPKTTLEAVVVGPADPVSQKLLEKQAVKKLQRIIAGHRED